jgi:hypothetical protein
MSKDIDLYSMLVAGAIGAGIFVAIDLADHYFGDYIYPSIIPELGYYPCILVGFMMGMGIQAGIRITGVS